VDIGPDDHSTVQPDDQTVPRSDVRQTRIKQLSALTVGVDGRNHKKIYNGHTKIFFDLANENGTPLDGYCQGYGFEASQRPRPSASQPVDRHDPEIRVDFAIRQRSHKNVFPSHFWR